jgi:Tol biopolymer transport system component/tRNA A-37 threonylcarbamoyl transferase component Bud32
VPNFAPGQRLGSYELLSLIGSGGMGQVWKARDLRLGRTVAVKISKEEFSDRFRREALAIAQLNHPRVCTLHDVGPDYLVMEYLTGESPRGPLPLGKVLQYAGEICDALDAAHRQGITHRDLKPGNILLTPHGVKLLDFGLAKMRPSATDQETQSITIEGTVLGTPAYMAPEQIEGRVADARSDIFALGCVLYELTTGHRAFEGRTATETTAAILMKDPPPPSTLARGVPSSFDRVVAACLAKNADDRFQNVRDVKLALQCVGSDTRPSAVVATFPRSLGFLCALAALSACAVALWLFVRSPPRPPDTLRVALSTPGYEPADFGGGAMQIAQPSPDGKFVLWIVFNAARRRQLVVTSLESGTSTALTGTEDVGAAFWSPDGRQVAFFRAGKLQKISADGGSPQTIAQLEGLIAGSWGTSGELLLMPSNRTPLVVIAEAGGPQVQVTTLDADRFENSHRNVTFLPDGHHFLFTARSSRSEFNSVYLGDRRGKEVHRLEGLSSNAQFLPLAGDDGWLVYGREHSVLARRFNMRTGSFAGREQVVLEHVGYDSVSAATAFRASENGRALIYYEATPVLSEFRWYGRADQSPGGSVIAGGFKGQIVQPRLSPDGERVLFSRPDEKTGNRDLWLLDTRRAASARLTTSPANDWWGTWAPDGRGMYFASDRGPRGTTLFFKNGLESSAPETPVVPATPYSPIDITTDARWLLLSASGGAGSQFGMVVADLRSHSQPQPLLDTEFDEPVGRFSGDGHWLAYMSDETGTYEVYVRRIRDGKLEPSSRIPISRNGGEYPEWDRKGHELFFLGFDRTVYSVPFGPQGPEGEPVALFKACGNTGFPGEGTRTAWQDPYAVAPGGQRLLFRCNTVERSAIPLRLWRDWMPILGQQR